MKKFQSQPKLLNQIRQIRELRGINRKKLASAFGYKNTSPIGHWETGLKEPKLRNIIKLHIALGAELHQLFPQLYWEVERELSTHKSIFQKPYESKTDKPPRS